MSIWSLICLNCRQIQREGKTQVGYGQRSESEGAVDVCAVRLACGFLSVF